MSILINLAVAFLAAGCGFVLCGILTAASHADDAAERMMKRYRCRICGADMVCRCDVDHEEWDACADLCDDCERRVRIVGEAEWRERLEADRARDAANARESERRFGMGVDVS